MSPGRNKVVQVKGRALIVAAVAVLALLLAQGTATAAKVDINAATQAELEAVKGIGPVTAKNIIDNRPYKSLADLKKAGLSPKEINTLKPALVAKAAPAAAAPAAAPQAAKTVETSPAAKPPKEVKAPPAAAAPVDLNTSDQKALEALPGVGPALAKRIMEARPLLSLDDLGKVKGMSKAKVAALKDKVSFGPAASTAAPAAKPAPGPAAATEAPAAKAPPATEKPMPGQEPIIKTKPAPAPKDKAEAPKLAPGEKININTATQADLEKIPGIGPVKAKAIIEGRPYKTPEDIMKVRGIKEGIYSKIKDFIKVQ
ncbi:MAG: helix-hairpin-helix domain-containing protein [Desulfobaccales bacterium]